MNKELAKIIHELVVRIDDLVTLAQGNHCLTKETPWNRLECLEDHFSHYDERSLKAIVSLLEQPKQDYYDPHTNNYWYIAPKL
jgi:hypothetical protein